MVLAAIAGAAIAYGLLLTYAHLVDVRLDAELAAFDLNGDGSFSGSELTPAQSEAMDRVVDDTGRALAPITGILYSVLYVLVVICISSIVRMLMATNSTMPDDQARDRTFLSRFLLASTAAFVLVYLCSASLQLPGLGIEDVLFGPSISVLILSISCGALAAAFFKHSDGLLILTAQTLTIVAIALLLAGRG